MRVKLAVGDVWQYELRVEYRISFAGAPGQVNRCVAEDSLWSRGHEYDFGFVDSDGLTLLVGDWRLIKQCRPEKIIPDMPLDPTLPILQAGYIQDRQRKRFRVEKSK